MDYFPRGQSPTSNSCTLSSSRQQLSPISSLRLSLPYLPGPGPKLSDCYSFSSFVMVGKGAYLELAGWTQLRWFGFVGNVQSQVPAKNTPSSLSQALSGYLALVTSMLWSFTACLIGCLLALTPTVSTSVPLSSVFMADSVVGESWCWHRGELASSGCTLEGIGAASRATESWGLEDGWYEDLLLVAMDSFWHCLPGFPSICFGLGFGKVRRFLLCVHLWLLLLSPSKLKLLHTKSLWFLSLTYIYSETGLVILKTVLF